MLKFLNGFESKITSRGLKAVGDKLKIYYYYPIVINVMDGKNGFGMLSAYN
jgi:hypothetical protein